MVYGCGANTLKCLVFFFNLLAFISGLAILITCILAYTDTAVQEYTIGKMADIRVVDLGKINSINTILICGMIVGGILIILGFLGCCGACTENPCLLITFAVIMVIIVLIELGLAIAVLAFRGSVEHLFKEAVMKAGENAKLRNKGEVREPACNWFEDLNEHVHCCGVDGTIRGRDELPLTEDTFYCNDAIKCHKESQGRGCKEEVWNTFWRKAKVFGLVGIIMVILEIAAIVFACTLIYAMRQGKRLYERV